MQINLLKSGYKKSHDFYIAFISGALQQGKTEYIDESTQVIISAMPNLPVYLGKGKGVEKVALFLELVHVLERDFLSLSREYLMNEIFWHSYLCIYKREYLLKTYPEIKNSQKDFENIVTKDFDWQNYVYKAILAVQYISEHVRLEDQPKYYNWIFDNFDVFNYIISPS